MRIGIICAPDKEISLLCDYFVVEAEHSFFETITSISMYFCIPNKKLSPTVTV